MNRQIAIEQKNKQITIKNTNVVNNQIGQGATGSQKVGINTSNIKPANKPGSSKGALDDTTKQLNQMIQQNNSLKNVP